jgi:hypothetical protein
MGCGRASFNTPTRPATGDDDDDDGDRSTCSGVRR